MNGHDKENLSSALKYVETGMNRIRDISHLLHPYALESFGLIYAIQDFGVSMKHSKTCEIEINTEIEHLNISPFNQLMLFRIVQELIINAVKHGLANQFSINIFINDGFVNLIIFHNGGEFLDEDYFRNIQSLNTLGLKYIAQRLELLKCSIKFESNRESEEQKIQLVFNLPIDIE